MTDHPLARLIPRGSKVLWTASSGGHFAQLKRIADVCETSPESEWVTFDTPQTRGALKDENVTYADYIAPRQLVQTAQVARQIGRLPRGKFDVCVSTGSALATAVLPRAVMAGYKTIYIESITRVDGPSMSGRMLSKIPSIDLYTQHPIWQSKRWNYVGSILDNWASTLRRSPTSPRRIFVTLGTIKPFRFDRAVDAVLNMLEPGDEVVWQLGCTTRTDLPGCVHGAMKPDQMRKEMVAADIVVTHAGVGTVMELLDMGICPVIAVRDPSNDEHVDGHQAQIAGELFRRRLAVELDVAHPHRDSLDFASGVRIVKNGQKESSFR